MRKTVAQYPRGSKNVYERMISIRPNGDERNVLRGFQKHFRHISTIMPWNEDGVRFCSWEMRKLRARGAR